MWHAFASPRYKYPEARILLDYCIEHYTYPYSELVDTRRPKSQWAFVYYSDLVPNGVNTCNMKNTIIALLDRLYCGSSGLVDSSAANSLLMSVLDKETDKLLKST